jgi:hypothetical protein
VITHDVVALWFTVGLGSDRRGEWLDDISGGDDSDDLAAGVVAEGVGAVAGEADVADGGRDLTAIRPATIAATATLPWIPAGTG